MPLDQARLLPIDFSRKCVHLTAEGPGQVVSNRSAHPKLPGWVVGAGRMATPPPHAGERHPDGDELLYLFDGRLELQLELEEGPRRVELEGGNGFLVPAGVWHRLFVREPAHLIYITPGPNNESRPLRRSR